MLTKFYNKFMGFFALFKFLTTFLKGAKIPSILILMGLGSYYAYAEFNNKHDKSLVKIEKNSAKIVVIERQHAVVMSTLKTINNTVKKTDERIWQLSRDLKKAN